MSRFHRSLSRRLAVLQRTAFLAAVWLGLAGADPAGLALGGLAVPAALWLSLRLAPPGRSLRLGRLLRHLPRFLAGSVVGGVDVARRAFAPSMPLAPGWVTRSTSLPGGGRVALGAELSLMPGTLAAGCRGDRLIVHLLDRNAGFEDAIALEEAEIAAILGLPENRGDIASADQNAERARGR